MPARKIPFPALPWAAGSHPLERKKAADPPGATPAAAALLEFLPAFRDPNWCVGGHAGLVLEGVLGLELDDDNVLIGSGEGYLVDPGTRHRAFNPGPDPVRLFIAPRS